MTETQETTLTDDHSELFTIKPANQWREEAAGTPAPAYLFDEFWLEGEVALLFGRTGKTTLAVQIADSIATGNAVGPLRMTAKAQKVIFLDLNLTAKQFATRYTADSGGEGHVFSPNFQRVEMPEATVIQGARGARKMARALEWLVSSTGARVLVIDNITCFRRSSHGTIGEVLLMRELNRLKRKHRLSILVVANNEMPRFSDEISVRDLGASAILANFADSVFAIGLSGGQGPYRYFKHLRSRGADVTFDADQTISFRLNKINGNFLGFTFEDFFEESCNIDGLGDGMDKANLKRAFELHDEGRTIRNIADELFISKSKVHRLLKMERPPAPKPPEPAPAMPANNVHKAKAEMDEWDQQRIEDDEFDDSDRYNDGAGPYTPADIARFDSEFEDYGDADETDDISLDEEDSHSESIPWADKNTPKCPTAGLEREINELGKEIFVERRDGSGKPAIWYIRSGQGILYRKKRVGSIVYTDKADTS